MLQEIVPTLSTYLHLHIPLSHVPGSQSFPDIRNQPDQSEVESATQKQGLILTN